MNRSHWIIAGLGILACVALSLMMERAVGVHQQRSAGPVAAAVSSEFGSRLERPATFRVVEEHGRKVGQLLLEPSIGTLVPGFARDAGVTAWLEVGRDGIDRLVVVCDLGNGTRQSFDVPPPWPRARQTAPVGAPVVPAPTR